MNAHYTISTQKLQRFQETTTEFVKKYITPIAQEIDENNSFPRELWPKLAKANLLGLTISKEYGGNQWGYLAQAMAMEIISQASARSEEVV